jgi:hypothetical protein
MATLRGVRVEVQAEGAAQDVVPAFTDLGNTAREQGWIVRIENPAELAAGSGRFEIELPNIDDEEDARAAVRSLIDQVPHGNDVFTIIDRDT